MGIPGRLCFRHDMGCMWGVRRQRLGKGVPTNTLIVPGRPPWGPGQHTAHCEAQGKAMEATAPTDGNRFQRKWPN